MQLYTYLTNHFKPDQPIILSDLKVDGKNYNNIRQALARLTKLGRIRRYDSGVYYIPKQTILGLKPLGIRDVIEKKYILKDNKIIGYYSGLVFENEIGLSDQVPNRLEITTNTEATRSRKIKIRGFDVVLKRPRTMVTEKNHKLLQFLDYIAENEFKELLEEQEKLVAYVKQQHFKYEGLIEVLEFYPLKLGTFLIRLEIINEFTYE